MNVLATALHGDLEDVQNVLDGLSTANSEQITKSILILTVVLQNVINHVRTIEQHLKTEELSATR